MKTPVCRTCGGPVQFGNLYCSKPCGEIAKEARQTNAKRLEQHGFVQDPESPNLYHKDGVAVSLEQVHHLGVAVTLERHLHAVTQRKAT